MALITLDQLLTPLRYDTGSNVLTISGSLNVKQANPNIPGLILSGSFNLTNSLGVASGSYNGNPLDGGSY
jgi:hypothetical protein